MPVTEARPAALEETHAFSSRRTTARDLLFLIALLPILVAPSIGRTELVSTDEARYTEVAREMRLADEWVAPVLNGEAYWEKPALFFDLLQVSQRLTGDITAVGSRLVVVPFAALTLLALYGCGFVLRDRRTGLRAAVVLATSALFIEYAQYASLDMPMLAFITGAILGHLVATRTDRPSGRWHLFAAICMGLGCHFKGPVAIVLPGIVMLADAVPRRGWRTLCCPAPYWMPLVALGVLGVWLVPMVLDQGSAYFDDAIGRHVVDRSVGGDSAPHARGPLEYLPKILTVTFPWSLVLPFVLVETWRRRRGSDADPSLESPLRFPALWALSIPLVLSCIASKRTQYLLPALPGFALWFATWFEVRRESASLAATERVRGTGTVRAATLATGALAGLAIVAGILGVFALRGVPDWLAGSIPVTGRTALTSGLVLAVGAVAAGVAASARWWVRPGAPARVFVALVVLGIGTQTIHHALVRPWIAAQEHVPEFGATLRSEIDGGAEVAVYGMRLDGTYLLHSGETHFRQLDTPQEVVAYLAEDPHHRVVTKLRSIEKQIRPVAPRIAPTILAEAGTGRGRVGLLSGVGDDVARVRTDGEVDRDAERSLRSASRPARSPTFDGGSER